MVLAITHLVYTLNDYNRYRLSPEWLPQEFEFLRENLKGPVAAGDAELLGEFVDCLRAFGLPESDRGCPLGGGVPVGQPERGRQLGRYPRARRPQAVSHCVDRNRRASGVHVERADGVADGGARGIAGRRPKANGGMLS